MRPRDDPTAIAAPRHRRRERRPLLGSAAAGVGGELLNAGGVERADLLGDVLGVVLDPAQQGGAPGVLPGQAEKVEPGRCRYPPLVNEAAVLIKHLGIDPGVVDSEAGGPDDAADVELRAVREGHGRTVGVDRPRVSSR